MLQHFYIGTCCCQQQYGCGLVSLFSHPALWQADRKKVSTYLSPKFSLKAAWNGLLAG